MELSLSINEMVSRRSANAICADLGSETVMQWGWGMSFSNFGVFDKFGTKAVTKTDKEKGAFVPNLAQKDALSAAGYNPGLGGGNAIAILIEVISENIAPLNTSYYGAIRTGSGRPPEVRMGIDFINWLQIGDTVGIGIIGTKVYAWKDQRQGLSFNDVAAKIAKTANQSELLAKARKVQGPPARQEKKVSDFKRNLAVVAGAISRSNGACEMPACSSTLFQKVDGQNFLEVHHIIPLAEGGDDAMKNAAALCPMCHRELHFGAGRVAKRLSLKAAIDKKEP